MSKKQIREQWLRDKPAPERRKQIIAEMASDRLRFVIRLAKDHISDSKEQIRFYESVRKNARKELARRRS